MTIIADVIAAGLLTLSNVYAFCLLLGLGYTVLAALLGSIGGHGPGDFGHDLDIGHDIDLSADHGAAGGGHHGEAVGGAHLGPFSPLIIALFLVCFGGTGLVFTSGGMRNLGTASLAPAAGSAFVFAAVAAWAFNRLFARMEADSQANASELIGRSAKVIVAIPAGPGAGRVAVVVRNTRYTLTARSEDAVAMEQGQDAVVLRVVGKSCFVAPVGDPRALRLAEKRA